MATNRTLSKIISTINKERLNKYDIYVSLSPSVDLYQLYCTKSREWLNYYLVHMDGNYCGIVYDMDFDIHVYIPKKYRKNTPMNYCLNHTIIPHILLSKKSMTITFANEKVENYYKSELYGFITTAPLQGIIEKTKAHKFVQHTNHNSKIDLTPFNLLLEKTKADLSEFVENCESRSAAIFLINEPFVSESDYDFLDDSEKNTYTISNFLRDKPEINSLIDKRRYCLQLSRIFHGNSKYNTFATYLTIK